MECPHCGQQIENDSKECIFCSMPVVGPEGMDIDEYREIQKEKAENYYKKQWKGATVFLGCSIFFIILAIAFFIFSITKFDLLIVLIGELSLIISALFFYYMSYVAQETHETNIMIEEMYKRGKN